MPTDTPRESETPARPTPGDGKLYAQRDIETLGDLYFKHLDGMTREGLHTKSAIAAELAHRDAELAALRAEPPTPGDRMTDAELDAIRQRAEKAGATAEGMREAVTPEMVEAVRQAMRPNDNAGGEWSARPMTPTNPADAAWLILGPRYTSRPGRMIIADIDVDGFTTEDAKANNAAVAKFIVAAVNAFLAAQPAKAPADVAPAPARQAGEDKCPRCGAVDEQDAEAKCKPQDDSCPMSERGTWAESLALLAAPTSAAPDAGAESRKAKHPQLSVLWRHDLVEGNSFHMIRSADDPPSMIVADDVYPPVAEHIVSLHNAALFAPTSAAPGTLGEDAAEEGAGWKQEAGRLRELCKKQEQRIEDLTPYIDLFRRLDKRFGCGHTENGAEDAEALLRHVDELFEKAQPAKAPADVAPAPERYACQQCGRRDGMDAVAANETWERIRNGHDILCLWCMDRNAKAAGISGSVTLHFAGEALIGSSQSDADADHVSRLVNQLAAATARAEESREAGTRPVEVSLENLCRRAWHTNCPNWMPESRKGQNTSGIMRQLSADHDLTLEDGSPIPLWECTHCGQKAYAGVEHSTRRIVVRPFGESPALSASATPDAGAGEDEWGWSPQRERIREAVRKFSEDIPAPTSAAPDAVAATPMILLRSYNPSDRRDRSRDETLAYFNSILCDVLRKSEKPDLVAVPWGWIADAFRHMRPAAALSASATPDAPESAGELAETERRWKSAGGNWTSCCEDGIRIGMARAATPDAGAGEREAITVEQVGKAIRDACTVCGGTGYAEYRPAQYVTREMAVDAGDASLEGEPLYSESPSECEYCGRPIAAVRAAFDQTAKAGKPAD